MLGSGFPALTERWRSAAFPQRIGTQQVRMSGSSDVTKGQEAGSPTITPPTGWGATVITLPSRELGSREKATLGTVLYHSSRRCTSLNQRLCTSAVSTCVLTISSSSRTMARGADASLCCGTVTQSVSTQKESEDPATLFVYFSSMSPALPGRRGLAKNRNQHLESAHSKNNGSILLKKCLDCWFVYFSSFSEGAYQNFGDKAKLGGEREERERRKCACPCTNRELFSLKGSKFPSNEPAHPTEASKLGLLFPQTYAYTTFKVASWICCYPFIILGLSLLIYKMKTLD